RGVGLLRLQAGDPVGHLPRRLAVHGPLPHQLKALRQPRPLLAQRQDRGRPQRPPRAPAVPLVHRRRHPLRRRRGSLGGEKAAASARAAASKPKPAATSVANPGWLSLTVNRESPPPSTTCPARSRWQKSASPTTTLPASGIRPSSRKAALCSL